MKCYYHPGVDAVGLCAQCGKAACRDCIEDVGGVLLCASCRERAQEQAQHEYESEAQAVAHYAWKSLRNSRIWAIVGAAVGVFIGFLGGASTMGFWGGMLGAVIWGALLGYGFWATYWGFKWMGPWLGRVMSEVACFGTVVFWLAVLFIVWEIALIYGALGGALYQHFKHRRLLAEASGMA